MLTEGFDYEVKRMILFDQEELEIMLEVAKTHYDGRCKLETPKLLGWMHRQWTEKHEEKLSRAFTFRELDELCKGLEMARFLPDIDKSAKGCMLEGRLTQQLTAINT